VGSLTHRRLSALLNVHSFFSFGAGVSSPTALVKRAAELGYTHIALTDDLGVYGAAELHVAARSFGVVPLVGATVPLEVAGTPYPVLLLAESLAGYETLNCLVTLLHASEEPVTLPVLAAHAESLHLLTGGRRGFPTQLLGANRRSVAEQTLCDLKGIFSGRLWVQLYFDAYPWDLRRARLLRELAHAMKLPAVAALEVRYAVPELYPLYDALVCARLGITVDTPHPDRPQNGAQAVPESLPLPFPDALENASRLAELCSFDLLPERFAMPPVRVPEGMSAQGYLEERCYGALGERYSGETFMVAKTRLELELVTLRSLSMAEFFLLAAEVTDFCRSRGIVASGRGSAAASVVCYLLGVTTTDPVAHDLLFERFLHTGRRIKPDIDIDVGSHRRDEVFVWLRERFGKEHAAMVCNRVTYGLPSAVQDLGRALGIPAAQRNALNKAFGRDYRFLKPHRAREALPAFEEVLRGAPVQEVLLGLLERIEKGFVRHIAPHSGGWVVSRKPLSHYSPIQVSTGGLPTLQFDKDDVERLGLIKLDVLALRMLSCLERAREEVFRVNGVWLELSELPDAPAVWERIQIGDTLGIFQIESPGQVRMSVQLKPTCLTDLKNQVSLHRPGPIQSGSVHPFVARQRGRQAVTYLHPSLEPVLAKSHGVLLFQEDIMRLAVTVAGFSWTEAELFRKHVTSFDELSEIEAEHRRFIAGAVAHTGMSREVAEQVFELCSVYRGYGFAESHAWAFAVTAYKSAWVRHHYPAEYLAAFLSDAPGMWSASTLRHEAQRWGVGFLKLELNASGVFYAVEVVDGQKWVRPPFTAVAGLSEELAGRIVRERRSGGPFASVRDLFERVILERDVLDALARAGAFDRIISRRDALFEVAALTHMQPPGRASLLSGYSQEPPPFPALSLPEKVTWDYRTKGLSEYLVHPIDLIRRQLLDIGATPMVRLPKHGFVTTAGLVVARQKPPTAQGFAFFVIEDGPERVRVVISAGRWERHREVLRDASVLLVEGLLETEGLALTLSATDLCAVPLSVKVAGYDYG
jgi:error-prone DNA polymerase